MMNWLFLAPATLLIFATQAIPCEAQMIVAHRGASYDAPENTLAAFELAAAQGADGIEFDIQLTRDGIPVARLSPRPGRALTASALFERHRRPPATDPDSPRRDIDDVLATTLFVAVDVAR